MADRGKLLPSAPRWAAPGTATEVGDTAEPLSSADALAWKRDGTFLHVVIAAVVLLQRFALPLGGDQLPLVLPIVVIAVLWAVARGVLAEDQLRFQLYLTAIIGCVGAATITVWRGLDWSPLSLLYLVVIYLPFSFHLRRPSPEHHHEALSFFLKVMRVAAVLGIVQVGAQVLGWVYSDPLGFVPSGFLLDDYNTSYPVTYGSSIHKANGFLFLEPSFFSQFVALALIVHIYLRRRPVGVLLYVAALIASVSGTGVLLAGAGSAFLLVARGGRQMRALLLVGVLALLAALSPVGSLFTSRISEFRTDRSSAQGRFIAPYGLAASRLSSGPTTFLTGAGPGAAERLSQELEERTDLTAVFPVVPKLALEYGVPAAVVFLCFILISVLRGVPSVPLALAVLIMYLTLSGSLLQPATVYTLFLFTSLFASRSGAGAPEHRRSSDGPASPVTTGPRLELTR